MFPGVYSSLYWNERLGAHPFLVQCLYQLSCSCCASLKQTSAWRTRLWDRHMSHHSRLLPALAMGRPAASTLGGTKWKCTWIIPGLSVMRNPGWPVPVRTISDAKSWLTSAGYRHVIRNPSGMISMDLVMSNHCRHHLRWHLMKLYRRHDQIRPKSCRSNVTFESWYFVRYL